MRSVMCAGMSLIRGSFVGRTAHLAGEQWGKKARLTGAARRRGRGCLGGGEHGGGAGVLRRQERDPLVARFLGDGGGDPLANLVLRVGVVLLVDAVLDADEAAEVGPELRLDRGDADPAAVGAAVEVVAGVARAERRRTRLARRAGRELLVDLQRHE